MSCESCIYYLGTVNIFDKVGYLCSLTKTLEVGVSCHFRFLFLEVDFDEIQSWRYCKG